MPTPDDTPDPTLTAPSAAAADARPRDGAAGEGTQASAPCASAPAVDRCPRCGGAFQCGVAGPGPCPCSTVTLSPALQDRLRGLYAGCLCLACLVTLAAADDVAPQAATPANAPRP
jgi:hypothetical protein